MILFKNCVVAIVTLLLTMQGLNAVAMPLCEHGAAGSTLQTDAKQTAEMAHAYHDHGLEPGQDNSKNSLDPQSHVEDGLACDDCEFCALSCASTLPSAELGGAAGPGYDARSTYETLLVGVTPHHLSKPPLLA